MKSDADGGGRGFLAIFLEFLVKRDGRSAVDFNLQFALWSGEVVYGHEVFSSIFTVYLIP